MKFKCPNCCIELTKVKDTREGIKICPSCKVSWFILMCRGPKDEAETTETEVAAQSDGCCSSLQI